LAASIQEELGLEAKLIRGRGGVFEVRLDGETLFSKKRSGRFPEAGEVEKLIAARHSTPPGES
jgi:selenoprotein W-related protein